jgi:hypothetical protein
MDKKDTCKCKCKCVNKCIKKCINPPTYTELAVPVPIPNGVQKLPSFVYFDIDNRFTANQRQRISDAISGTMFAWATHMLQKWNGGANNGVSQLAACSNTYATRNLQPVWYKGPSISNGLEATNLAMNQFTRMIRDNGFRQIPKAKIDYRIPSPITSSTIRGKTASRQASVPLSFIINPIQLDRVEINNVVLSGSMFHAWLHRAGFQDPKTTSYFISEAPMCLLRGYQSKVPGARDSVFYQFFD